MPMRNLYAKPIHGISLIEVLVVLAIVGILTAIASPSFLQATQKFRISAESNALFSAITFARSESIKRGLPVTICGSSDGVSCLSTPTWETGWIVFTDANANGTVGTVLRQEPAQKSTDTIKSDNQVTSLTFGREGFTVSLPAGVVTFTVATNPANSSATQCIAVSKTGRLEMQLPGKGACT